MKKRIGPRICGEFVYANSGKKKNSPSIVQTKISNFGLQSAGHLIGFSTLINPIGQQREENDDYVEYELRVLAEAGF